MAAYWPTIVSLAMRNTDYSRNRIVWRRMIQSWNNVFVAVVFIIIAIIVIHCYIFNIFLWKLEYKMLSNKNTFLSTKQSHYLWMNKVKILPVIALARSFFLELIVRKHQRPYCNAPSSREQTLPFLVFHLNSTNIGNRWSGNDRGVYSFNIISLLP